MQHEMENAASRRSRVPTRRHKFFQSILTLTFGYLAALLLLSGSRAWAAPLNQDSQGSNLNSSTISYDSGGIPISAFLVKPAGSATHPAIVMAHDSQGLNDAMRDIAQQFAQAGFVVLVPDLLSRVGGTKSAEQATAATGRLIPNDTVADLAAGLAYLQKDPDVDPIKISSVGFGWGGWRSFSLATTTPEVYRVVVYCGTTPLQGLQNIHVPVLGNYAQYDFSNAADSFWTSKQLGNNYTRYIYSKAQKNFYNPKSRQYDAEAAKTAWTRTLQFLQS
jgi:carboxymethylenebutenolidase